MSTVPIFKSLENVYGLPSSQRERWQKLVAEFRSQYGRAPEFIVRCPGRVNIIGEHIDYSLYEVLPMAIADDVIIAASAGPRLSPDGEGDGDGNGADNGNSGQKSGPSIHLSNILPSRFPSKTIKISSHGDVDIDASVLEWSNYFKAGFRGASQYTRQRRAGASLASTICALVDGTVPPGAGLSSSSAFVCASALAVLAVNGVRQVEKTSFVEAAIVAERSIGVSSGGMDQAASILSQPGSALYVSFFPRLSAKPISFPSLKKEFAFLIAQTFVSADKHTTGPVNYNLRVAECTMSAHVMFKLLGLKGSLRKDHSPQGTCLRGLQDAYFKNDGDEEDGLNLSIDDQISQLDTMVRLSDEHLVQREGYTREDIASTVTISLEELEERFLRRFPVRTHRFKLRQRALHVFEEAKRVKRFYALLSQAAQSTGFEDEALLCTLGEIMNEGQVSCRDLYENSCPELDELCSIARREGSYGSRLTGAGFGGSTVHLVPRDRIEAIKNAWKEEYYSTRWPEIGDQDLESWKGAVVVSEPEGGASILHFTQDSQDFEI